VKIKIIILTLLVLIGSVAHAQIGTAIVNATGTFSVSPSDTITLKTQIVSCGAGQLPLYNGVPISLTPNQTPASPFTASNTGSAQSVSFTVPGNDGISCGGQNYSLYAITWYDNGFPLAPTQTFRFAEQTTQTLAQLAPVSFIPPVIVNSAGALCPATTPVFSGFDKNYHIICGVTGSLAAMPVSGGTFTGPVTFSQSTIFQGTTYAVASNIAFINGSVEVDQFSGSDFCAKMNAAIAYAVANHRPNVDASHFNGVQACTSNVQPFSAITGVTDYTSMNIEVQLGNVHITTTYPWEFRNSGLSIQGRGSMHSQFEYVGAAITTAPAFYVHAQNSAVTNGLEEVNISGIFFLVRNSAAKYVLYTRDVNRSHFDNDAFWGAVGGASGADYESQGNVTTTLYRPKVSQRELVNLQPASDFPGPYTAVGVTTFGFEFNQSTASGNQTTDGTVIDIAAEYVNIGMQLTSANSMTFTSGTSEANAGGVQVASISDYNSFIGLDVEGNSVYDVLEGGRSNFYKNVIATSVSFSSTATWDVWDNGNIQVGNFVNNAPLSNSNVIKQQGFFNLTPEMWANNLAGVPTNMPFSGTSHLWGGIGGMNATGSGGELDIFSAFIGATYDLCTWQNSSPGGYVREACLGPVSQLPGLDVSTKIVNDQGFQNVAASACTMTAGAIGNTCALTMTFTTSGGVAEPDANYKPTCTAVFGTGAWTVANITAQTATTMTLNLIALSTTATSTGGFVNCTLIHL
jgi:hypothetical protein